MILRERFVRKGGKGWKGGSKLPPDVFTLLPPLLSLALETLLLALVPSRELGQLLVVFRLDLCEVFVESRGVLQLLVSCGFDPSVPLARGLVLKGK